jgi:hypothetical protein
MPRIKLKGLTTYTPGAGFGSDIIAPVMPQIGNLIRMKLYGTAYAGEVSDGTIDYVDAIGNLPTDMVMSATGIESIDKRSVATGYTLTDIFEPEVGTLFFVLTHSMPSSDYVDDRGDFIASTKRLVVDYRLRGGDASTATQPYAFTGCSIDAVTKDDANGVATVSTGESIPAQVPDTALFLAVTKDAANSELTGYAINRKYVAYTTISQAFTGTEPYPISFGNKIDMQEITLHCAGYYDLVLTPTEITDLWDNLKLTMESAGVNVD